MKIIASVPVDFLYSIIFISSYCLFWRDVGLTRRTNVLFNSDFFCSHGGHLPFLSVFNVYVFVYIIESFVLNYFCTDLPWQLFLLTYFYVLYQAYLLNWTPNNRRACVDDHKDQNLRVNIVVQESEFGIW